MKKDDQDFLDLLIKIDKNPKYSQRKLAGELGFSLGKLNYCLKALKDKGLVKINNFQKTRINLIISIFSLHQELKKKLNLH